MPSPSLPQGFTLQHSVIPDDIPATVDIGRQAFKEDALNGYIIPAHVSPAGARQWKIERSEKRLMDPADAPRRRYVNIVKDKGSDDEEIVAVAGWWAPRVGKEGKRSDEEKAAERREALKNFPDGAKLDELNTISESLEGLKKIKLGDDWEERYWYLSVLATKPSYARQGFGAALVRWGVQQAEAQVKEDPEGPVQGLYIEATPIGLPVYLKTGFREVASLTHDLADGTQYKHVCLMRKLR